MTEAMFSARRARRIQICRDFLIGLGLYTLILGAASYLPDRQPHHPVPLFSSAAYAAVPLELIRHTAPAPAVYRSTDSREATAILGLAFASLVAFNLAFVRHLRRVYASPR